MKRQRPYQCTLIAAIATGLSLLPPIASHADRSSVSDAAAASAATAALAPYYAAHAYRGAVSITTSGKDDDAPVTSTTSIQAVIGADGAVTQYKSESLRWCAGSNVATQDSEHITTVCDGKSVWSYYSALNQFTRTTYHPLTLADILRLPPADARWSIEPTRRHLADAEERLTATIGGDHWHLYLDAITHRLHRTVHMSGRGATRKTTTIEITNIGFDSRALVLQSGFEFQPPVGARESRPDGVDTVIDRL